MHSEAKPSILIVEDENMVALSLVSTLENLRYPLAGVAASGEEAVRLAQRTAPELVLVDINMSSSVDVARQLQEKLFLPVIYLLESSDDATLERARTTQPFGYVLQPFEAREIELAIQTTMFRHAMERALRDSQTRLDAILSSIADAVIATDTEGRITVLNRAAETLLHCEAKYGIGRPLSEVFEVSSRPDGSLWLPRPGFGPVPIELVESPVLDASGKPSGHVTIARDLSERLRAQEAHDRELVERAARAVVEKEHARARLKSEISLVLADIAQPTGMAATLKRVAELIVASDVATWCVLHLGGEEDVVRVSAHSQHANRDKAQRVEELVQRWPPDRNAIHGAYAVMNSGQPDLVANVTEEWLQRVARDPQHLEALHRVDIASFLCVPLRARHRTLGALSFVASETLGPYTESDVTFAQQIADRVAFAIDNARLYQNAQQAKTSAEQLYLAEQQARAEAEALFRIADAINEAQLDSDAVIQRVTDEATAVVGAKYGAFFYNVVDDNGEAYMLYTLSGAPRSAFEKFGMPRNTPIFESTFEGRGIVRLDDVQKDPRYGRMAPHHGMPKGHLPVTSYLAVPVVSRRGPVIGGLFFGHPKPARFTEQHERMAKALAAHAAVALENAHLFKATRDAEERQGRLVRELERALRFSEMFVGILGHDLRNPLAGISTAASLVLNRESSERIAKPVRRILSSAERMSRMIDQILDFTRVRLGRGILLQPKKLELANVCQLVLDELEGNTDSGDIACETHGDSSGTWDEDRLTQLVSNLAGNALQHRTPNTSVVVRVDGSDAEKVRLEVQNQGVIPPEFLPHTFEPLRGGGSSKREGSSGLGLGLYISQQIAMAHGGSIRVASDAELGTRFTVELPRTPESHVEGVFSPSEGTDSG